MSIFVHQPLRLSPLLAVVCFLLLLIGCGGGGSGGTAETGGTGSISGAVGSMPDSQRAQAMSQALAAIQNLPVQGGIHNPTAMLAALKPIKGYTGLTIAADGSIIGYFSDKVPVVFINNELSTTGPSTTTLSQKPSQTSRTYAFSKTVSKLPAKNSDRPGSSTVMVMDTDDKFMVDQHQIATGNFDDALNFRNNGYPTAVHQYSTVENLRALPKNLGVFYITGHGGECYDPHIPAPAGTPATNPGYALWTETASNYEPGPDYNAPQYEGDIKDNSLALMCGQIDSSASIPQINAWHYGILSNFIIKYKWKFSENSFVSLNACKSQTPFSAYFRTNIKDAGASVIAGWSNDVVPTAAFQNNSFLFDRLLGANTYLPIPLGLQRPYSAEEILAWMQRNGKLTVGQGSRWGIDFGSSTWTFTPPGSPSPTTFDILKPNVAGVIIAGGLWASDAQRGVVPKSPSGAASTTVTLTGDFGTEPGTVNIGGSSFTPTTWTPTEVDVSIPGGSLPPAGDVYVTITSQDGGSPLESNVRQISQWSGTITDSIGVEGTATFNVMFAADVGQLRSGPDEPLTPPAPLLNGASGPSPSSTCTLSGAQSFTNPQGYSYDVTQEQPTSLPILTSLPTQQAWYTCELYPPTTPGGAGQLAEHAFSDNSLSVVETSPEGVETNLNWTQEFFTGSFAGSQSLPTVATKFDSNFNMLPGSSTTTTLPGGGVTLDQISWTQFTCTSPPSTTTAR